MSEIMETLSKVSPRLSEENFLKNKGLSNEVGLYVFPYKPEDEITVRAYFENLKSQKNVPYHLIECDLYKIFLSICEDHKILDRIPDLEVKKGKKYLLEQLQKVATPEAYISKMQYESHQKGDVLLITGVGKVYPFMRSHLILNNIQHVFEDIPVVMLYPGEYDHQSLKLFGIMLDDYYYRAFNLL